MRTRLTILILTFALIPVSCSAGETSSADKLNLKSPWFSPSSTIDADAICASILSGVREHFKSSDDWDSYPAHSSELFIERIDNPRESPLIDSDGARLYAYFQNINGCGGACETAQVLVSDEPFPEGRFSRSDLESLDDSQIASTPQAPTWNIYKANSGLHYVVGVVDRHLQVYKVTAPREWRKSCDIALAPERLRDSTDLGVRAAVQSLDALNAAVHGLTRGAGNCGSMQTAGRWNALVEDSLEQTLYRPWALRSTAIGWSEKQLWRLFADL